MNQEKITEWARSKPLFTFADLERKFNYYNNYSRVGLHKMVDKGKIKEIEPGKYTVHEDMMIPASHVEKNSFISLETALNYYNLIERDFGDPQVITNKHRNSLKEIKFHYSDNLFGYVKKKYKGFDIFIADKERLLLDCLSRETVPAEDLKYLVNEIDREKVIDYSKRFAEDELIKKVRDLVRI